MSQEVMTVSENVVGDALSASAIRAQVDLIQHVMKEVMIKDTHYGIIPGTPKPSLYKPGAEKLCLTFRLDPQYESTERYVGEHCFVKSRCTLYHQTTGRRLGSGEGSCSTKEAKYAYRKGQRLCPYCGKEAIIKGKEQYGGGWLCWKKKEGCGAQWPDGAKEIEDQNTERIPNEDLADQYNTVLKMANKRSLIAAVLNVTGASDIFTQDIEDMPEFTEKKADDSKNPGDDAGLTPPGRTVATATVTTQHASEATAPNHLDADRAIEQQDVRQEYVKRFQAVQGAAANPIYKEVQQDGRLTQESKDSLYKTYTTALKTRTVK